MRLDEKTFAPMDESKIDAAMNRVMMPGHPEIFEAEPQIVNLIVAQAIVLRQNDLDAIAAYLQLAAQPENHIA